MIFNNNKKKKRPPAREARLWSNQEIRIVAGHIKGRVINISAWEDQDKEGGQYRDYFRNASQYQTSNFQGWRGDGIVSDYNLDLEGDVHEELLHAFDLVLNHTTLEHVFDIHKAMRNLCSLSKDAVMIVVPFMQHLHGPEDRDFWRPSPYALRRIFKDNGFQIIRETAGPAGGNVRYLFYLASCRPESWQGRLPAPHAEATKVLRSPVKRRFWRWLHV